MNSVRPRPEDGGITWHERWNAFECRGCEETEEIRSARLRTPEKLAELRELLIADHTECWQFSDAEQARQQRRFRKRKTLNKNLAAQRVSWRGSL